METTAKQAWIVDLETGAVLLDKDGTTPTPPASLSKLMTLYMVFERLKQGKLSLDDEFVVSRKAWRMGGSKMFVEVGRRVRLEDLVRGIVVSSGNDACIVVAEGLSGSEAAFADAMNRRAREIGLAGSHFVNATGWPDAGHAMTPRDIALLSRRLIEDFPEYYPYFAEKRFRHNRIEQGNRNPLLYRDSGADGLKTGYTRASGYGLAASAVRQGRRVVLVLTGLKSARARTAEARRLLDWAYAAFRNHTLFESGAAVETADVWLGDEDTVPLVTERDIRITLPRASRPGLPDHAAARFAPGARGEGRLRGSGTGADRQGNEDRGSRDRGARVRDRRGAAGGRRRCSPGRYVPPSGRGDLPHALGPGAVEAAPRPRSGEPACETECSIDRRDRRQAHGSFLAAAQVSCIFPKHAIILWKAPWTATSGRSAKRTSA